MPSPGSFLIHDCTTRQRKKTTRAFGFWKLGGFEKQTTLRKAVEALAAFGCRRYKSNGLVQKYNIFNFFICYCCALFLAMEKNPEFAQAVYESAGEGAKWRRGKTISWSSSKCLCKATAYMATCCIYCRLCFVFYYIWFAKSWNIKIKIYNPYEPPGVNME